MTQTVRRSWRFVDGVILAGLAALAIGAAWPVWVGIFDRAINDAEQSHVLLAPLIALWLVWVRRERLRRCRPRWSFLGPALIALGMLSGFIGFTNSHLALEDLGAVLALAGAIITVVGVQTTKQFLPAFIALLFLIPVPGMIRQQIALPLQNITAVITTNGLDLLGFPVAREGNVIVINGREVAVAEACNGMRMVSALVLVSFAFVFSTPMRQSVRFVILAASPIVALICNVIRLTPVVLFYGYSTTATADFVHDVSGWLVLLIALGILWLFLTLLRWIEIPVTPYAVAQD
jgi:exosortase